MSFSNLVQQKILLWELVLEVGTFLVLEKKSARKENGEVSSSSPIKIESTVNDTKELENKIEKIEITGNSGEVASNGNKEETSNNGIPVEDKKEESEKSCESSQRESDQQSEQASEN